MNTFQWLRRAPRTRARPARPHGVSPAAPDQRAALQEALGYPIQAKLRIGAPDDAQEREADAVADRITAAPGSMIQRKCAACDQQAQNNQASAATEDKDEELQRKAVGGEATLAPAGAAALAASRGAGHPLAARERSFFEPRLNANLSGVRLHADAQAAHLSDQLAARAFTFGSDIYFAAGAYQPGSPNGRRLLAHELTHVLQQGSAQTLRREPTSQPALEEPEREQAAGPTTTREVAVGEAGAERQQQPHKPGGVQADAQTLASCAQSPTTAAQPSKPEAELPATFCKPYESTFQTAAAHNYLNKVWLPYAAAMFGTSVAGLWASYLSRAKGSSLKPIVFDEPSGIAVAFRDAYASTADSYLLFNEVAAAMSSRAEVSKPLPAKPGGYTAAQPYNSTPVALTALLPGAALPRNIEYGWGAVSIPGNLAGGLGASDAGPDSRVVTGGVAWVSRYMEQGHEYKVVRIKDASYQVNDAVDFCPGNPGGRVAQEFTIPMSRLEMTPWTRTYDLPFQVNFTYDGFRAL